MPKIIQIPGHNIGHICFLIGDRRHSLPSRSDSSRTRSGSGHHDSKTDAKKDGKTTETKKDSGDKKPEVVKKDVQKTPEKKEPAKPEVSKDGDKKETDKKESDKKETDKKESDKKESDKKESDKKVTPKKDTGKKDGASKDAKEGDKPSDKEKEVLSFQKIKVQGCT